MKPIRLNQEEMATVQRAVWSTWQYISGDCGFVKTNYAAMEMCLDADRLTQCATHPSAQSEGQKAEAILKPLYQTAGFSNVCKYLSRRIRLV